MSQPKKIQRHTTVVNLNLNKSSSIQPSSTNQEFAAPGAYKESFCGGRLCAKCGKCREWYFAGDPTTWRWVRNVKNWKDKDWNRWRDDRIHSQFKLRDSATCVSVFCGHYGSAFGCNFYAEGFACLCTDNIVN